MNNFVKMDVAIELLADKISRTSRKFIETKDMKYEDELNYLFNERDKMYNGDVLLLIICIFPLVLSHYLLYLPLIFNILYI